MEQLPNQNQELKDQILQKIEGESMSPKSRWVFTCRELIVWVFLGFLVLISAIALAVTFSALIYGNYALYEATHQSFLMFLFDILPYLWLIIFGLVVFLAIFNVRHTKHGYRYALWKILGGTLLLSVVTGGIFHFFGLGFVLDKELGKMASSYPSREKFELRFWQNPEAGRLVGSSKESRVEKVFLEVIRFEDITGDVWKTDISSLSLKDLELLSLGNQVRLLGEVMKGDKNFHACAVFPWVYEYEYSRQELRILRGDIKNKLANFKDRLRDPLRQNDKLEVCDDLKVIKKFAPPDRF